MRVFTVMPGRDTDFVSCRNYHMLKYSGLFVARVCMGGGGEVLWLLVVSEGVEDCILKCGLGVV